VSTPAIPRLRIAVTRTALVAAIALVVAGYIVTLSPFHSQNAHAINSASNRPRSSVLNAEQCRRVRASLYALPLAFEANQGQTDPAVKYMARGNGYSVFLTANDAVFAIPSTENAGELPSRTLSAHTRPRAPKKLQNAAIDMGLVGGNVGPGIVADNQLAGIVNYYVGSDSKNWHTGVKQYSSISYRDVYPGVNMVFHGSQRQLEFDFVVSPGADPKVIELGFKGARELGTDVSGNLLLNSSAGAVVLHKPVAYQEKDGKREMVDAVFQVNNRNEVALSIGRYDRSRKLVIDPSLTYSTYLGGTAEDDVFGIASDSSGNAYVTGQTASIDFPYATGANAGGLDAFISKITPDGSSLAYSAYIGGAGNDSGNAIAVDPSLNVFVAGGTTSTNFPTQNPLQPASGGGVDAFVLELASNGASMVFSTYLGGGGDDIANGIAIDTTGVYVVGSTASTNFPVQNSGAFQATIHGTSNGFVTKLNTSGTTLAYSTYLGGGSNDLASAVAVDGAGDAYVTGVTVNANFPTTPGAFQTNCGTDGTCNGGLEDAFVTVFNPSGSQPIYSTFVGGEKNDRGLAIAVDSSKDAYVTGLTQSQLFPLKSALQSFFAGGNQDAFVTELNPSGNFLIYSTFLGGSGDDAGAGIAVDGSKNAYVIGQTTSTNFPMQAATQPTSGGGRDAFVTEIGTSGSSLAFSTYLGGASDENTNAGSGNLGPLGAIAVDGSGAHIYVVGNTSSSGFPTVSPLQGGYGGSTDGFVAKYATDVSSADFTVANGPLSATSGPAGVSAISTITVGSKNGFNSAVQLQCTVTPFVTNGPTCSFMHLSSGSLTPPANGTATATLNVATTAASAVLKHSVDRPHVGVIYALFLAVFGLTLLDVGAYPRRRKFIRLAIIGLVLISLLLLPSCSGNGRGAGAVGAGTPAGTYAITVTGTSGNTAVTGLPALALAVN